MDLNFFAAAELTRLALPHLNQGNRPIVVNVSSVLGHRGVPGCVEYCASKFALEGFSQALRAELAPLGIDLLVVSPARTKTEFFDRAIDADSKPWPLIRGMSSEAVARRTVRAIRRGQHHKIISIGGKALVWVNRLVPGVVDRVLARYS
jgi:short-subunit dehydrogenase